MAYKHAKHSNMAQTQVAQVPHLPTASATIMYSDLCRELIDVEATIRWCQSRKLLAEKKDCVCGRDLVKRKTTPEMRCWRCPRKACRKEVLLRDGTFFAKSHLEIGRIIRLIYSSLVNANIARQNDEGNKACYRLANTQCHLHADIYQNSSRLVQLPPRCLCSIFC